MLKWPPSAGNGADPARDGAGEPDVRLLQAELRAARDDQQSALGMLRDILYGADVATFLLDAGLNIEFFTPTAETLFRVLSTDVGCPFLGLIMVAGDDALETDIRDVAGGRSGERTALVTMYGKSYRRRVSPRYTSRDGANGVAVSYADVTATRTAQEEARASYEQVRNVVMMLPAPAAIVDDRGRLAHANPRFEAVIKDYPDLLERAVEHWRAMSEPDPGGPLTFSVAGLGRVQLSLAAVTAAAANPMHVIAVEPDAGTASSHQRFVADLEHLSQLRHEVIQPLQTLRMLHGIMLKRQADAEDFAARHRLEETFEALSGMLNSLFLQQELVNGLLVSHPGEVVALREIIDSLRPELGYHAAAKSLDWEIDQCPFEVVTEPRLLECLIRGLMLRVVRCINDGRLILSFRRDGDRVVIEFRQESERPLQPTLAETVPSQARNINELLFPSALVAQLSESLGVTVAVDSDLPEGQMCTISIPAAARDAATDARVPGDAVDAAAAANEGRLRQVCIVDDDDLLLQSVADALQGHGIHAITCLDVDTYLSEWADAKVDCVVVDAMMPGKDGFALIEALVEAPASPPIIMITGAGDVKLAVKAMKAGAADFIQKPFDAEQLADAVRRVCAESEDRSPQVAEPEAMPLQTDGLTARQKQVLELVVEGHANKEIAARLSISQRTVENHRAAVMRRTGARTLPDLIRMRLMARDPDRPGPDPARDH